MKNKVDKIKSIVVAIGTAVSSFLGVLAIPVYLLVVCNVTDYITGLMAAKYRGQAISSYRGFKGIAKKICMWLLVGVGAVLDTLIKYATVQAGISVGVNYIVASLAAVWLICNEIISILENIGDMGVALPPFLSNIVKNLKKQIEDKTDSKSDDSTNQ